MDNVRFFSNNLKSLKLQIDTLFDGVGSEATAEFLDQLSTLSQSEQAVLIKMFGSIVKRVADGGSRLLTEDDRELKSFEDSLYEDICAALDGKSSKKYKPLSVVSGGKSKHSSILIKLSERRKK